MNTTHFRIELRTDKKNKNGSYTLQLYANINGVKKYYSLHKYVQNPKHWNPDKQEVSVYCDNWDVINKTIQNYLSKTREFIWDADRDNSIISLDKFDRYMRGASNNNNSVIKFAENYILKFGNKYKPATLRSYKSQLNKLRKYNEKVLFSDLNFLFWTEYASYLIGIGNKQNTLAKSFRIIKVIINQAIEHGIIKDNPLNKVKVKSVPGTRSFLTFDELKSLEDVYKGILTKYQKNVLRSFLFACYTGLRYQDVKGFKGYNIIEGSRIEKVMQKNGKPVIVPLSERAKALLPITYLPSSFIFRVYANQPTNKALKVLAAMAGINKNVSFHVARHTFATLTLGLSNDIAAVQKLCGHSKIETTMIYAKVLEAQKKAAIDKWNIA